MEIWEDSRQQKGKHEIKHRAVEAHGDKLTRCALAYGDYCLAPAVSVDTKANMQEIAQNIGGTNEEHARFRRELVKAKDNGCHLYILIENEDGIRSVDDVARWWNPRIAESPRAITGERLCKAMHTMQERYGCTFVICTPEQAAGMIYLILERGI